MNRSYHLRHYTYNMMCNYNRLLVSSRIKKICFRSISVRHYIMCCYLLTPSPGPLTDVLWTQPLLQSLLNCCLLLGRKWRLTRKNFQQDFIISLNLCLPGQRKRHFPWGAHWPLFWIGLAPVARGPAPRRTSLFNGKKFPRRKCSICTKTYSALVFFETWRHLQTGEVHFLLPARWKWVVMATEEISEPMGSGKFQDKQRNIRLLADSSEILLLGRRREAQAAGSSRRASPAEQRSRRQVSLPFHVIPVVSRDLYTTSVGNQPTWRRTLQWRRQQRALWSCQTGLKNWFVHFFGVFSALCS